MYVDYIKIKNCIAGSTSLSHIHVCEILCELFKRKWKHDPNNTVYTVYLDKLIVQLSLKKQKYGE